MCDVNHFRFYSAHTCFSELRIMWPPLYDVRPKFTKIAEDVNSMNKALQSSPFALPR